MQQDEGVIKFRCEHVFADALPDNILTDLKHFRALLYMQKFIGVDDEGIGYGNISQLFDYTDQFIISGTQTGHIPELDSQHFTHVVNYSIEENWLRCVGPVKASSESLTHAALYSANQNIGAVIHIHNAQIWQKHLHTLPTTPVNISYGTPEIANAIISICTKSNLANGVIIMGGHKDGIITYGKNLLQSYNNLIDL